MLKCPPRIAVVVASTQMLSGKHRHQEKSPRATGVPPACPRLKEPKSWASFQKPHIIFARQRLRSRKTVNPNLLLSYLFLGWTSRSNSFKLRERRFRLDIRKKLFILTLVKPWHRLPREMVDVSSLETFQVWLDWALSNLVWLKISLLLAGGLG